MIYFDEISFDSAEKMIQIHVSLDDMTQKQIFFVVNT